MLLHLLVDLESDILEEAHSLWLGFLKLSEMPDERAHIAVSNEGEHRLGIVRLD
jgi:hypothetical protein